MSRMFRLIQATVALVAILAVVAACSAPAAAPGVATLDEPDGSAPPAASPSAALTPQDAALAYARCMRENGVDMPDPVVTEESGGAVSIDQQGGTPVSKEKMAAADGKCRHFMAAAGPGGPNAQISAEDLDKMLQFARCMREHGVDMPDPDPNGGIRVEISDSGGNGGGITGGPLNPKDPEFQAAQDACGDLLPGKLGKPGFNSGGADGKPGSGGGPAAPAGNQ
jgi:hypothetical protein